jgi:hypothetical protein
MDLFEDIASNPNNYPPKLVALVNKMGTEHLERGLDYDELAKYVKKFEAIGYTFDYYLDAEPYDLKKLA